MATYQYRGKQGPQFSLDESEDLIVIRSKRKLPTNMLPLSTKGRALMGELRSVVRYPEAGVEVLNTNAKVSRDEARSVLKEEDALRFAGRTLVDPNSKAPVLYTENFFVKFEDDVSNRDCKNILKNFRLTTKRTVDYAYNGFVVNADEGTGQGIFDIAAELLQQEAVELCHPELIREMAFRQAFPQQWHLKSTTVNGQRINAHAAVEAAWALTQGEGTTIAIIDDGVDMTHEEFQTSGKIIAPRDVTSGTNNPTPHAGANHGTACAGVACADGLFGAAGVAPKSSLIPIRLASGLGSQAEADAFFWAAQHGADVISCSWGPMDGNWWDANDPTHNQVVPLPDSTKLAIDWAVRNGRNGKGCIITWAAGNGGESVDNDGYASYENVVAVGASNDQSTHTVYSDFGDALWCTFPSSDFAQDTVTPGIWTTDRTGADGYNPGESQLGDTIGNYTNSFGGTSSSCPGAAGVAAIIIARNPHLRWDEVKEIMKDSCDKIDDTNGNYNAEGRSDHYGYGRLNAKKAAKLARPALPKYTAIHTAIQDVAIKDQKSSSIVVAVGDDTPIKSIKVILDIEHTYIGDLVVSITPPQTMNQAAIVLHDRFGGGTNNIKRTFDTMNTPDLANVIGENPQGKWKLQVADKANADTGKIRKFTVELGL